MTRSEYEAFILNNIVCFAALSRISPVVNLEMSCTARFFVGAQD